MFPLVRRLNSCSMTPAVHQLTGISKWPVTVSMCSIRAYTSHSSTTINGISRISLLSDTSVARSSSETTTNTVLHLARYSKFHSFSQPLLQRRVAKLARSRLITLKDVEAIEAKNTAQNPTGGDDNSSNTGAPGDAGDSDDGNSGKKPSLKPAAKNAESEVDNPDSNEGDAAIEIKNSGDKSRQRNINDKQSKSKSTTDAIIRSRSIRKSTVLDSSSANNGENSAIEKIVVPDEYPQLLAIPLTRRPLFPGFYKSLYIKEPKVIRAIQSLVEHRQPYIGIFLAKDENSENDVVTDISEVYRTGVFAQITNTYQTGPDSNALTVVVYPHRRICISELVMPLVDGTVEQSKTTTTEITELHTIESAEEKVADADSAETVVSKSENLMEEKTDESIARDTVEAEQDESELPRFLPVNAHLLQHDVPLANVANLVEQPHSQDNRLIKAITSEIVNVLKEISQLNPLLRDQIISISVQTGNLLLDPSRLADFAAAVSSGEPSELQSILESLVVEERLHKSLVVLKKELANAKLQQEISKEVERKMTRKQQEYFLMEQLKGIKKELGMESDGKEKLVEKFKAKAAKLHMPEAIKKVFDEEINKLQHLEPAASEFNVTRNYLDWLTQIPWGQSSKENYNIKHAVTVLDEDHYGLKDVKERILEFIAVGKLRGTVEGKIIAMVGPPGVGKTSVGKSIARALGREFYRFSVGGLSDVAEIKGHRRTYVGAMPGKVVQALKKVQTENPLIMIDEIDKLSRGNQGDPASALLELLDPEQNNSFLDHYLDVPLDLSKVLFVCTANTLDTIPAPLLDRMEIITLSGYVAEEKIAIASKYLEPASRLSCGLTEKDVTITDKAFDVLIKQYCRESGVRNLKKQIDKIFRKAAFKIVDSEIAAQPATSDTSAAAESVPSTDSLTTVTNTTAMPSTQSEDSISESTIPPHTQIAHKSKELITITPENLHEYVGSPIFTSDRLYEETPPGVVMGLAWTQMGGSSLFIESVLDSPFTDENKPSFQRTGQMGDVMKESTTIAYTYARAIFAKRFPENDFFKKAGIHMHVPEGATPKDGPSAGSTMTTSLLSLALNRPVIPDVAMTGEITLTGKILKIGGVKEKSIAAKRSGVKHIIFPSANKSDWDELPDYIKAGLNPHFVKWYDEIYAIVFPDI
ncbi:ATP-dependent Lon protease pim1 [Batrachochytrium dendrobatidis]|nr:ATP-dependent Lon protease pim1 [Batrachochytrium dendrobatidis]